MREWLLSKRSKMGLTQAQVAESAKMARSTYAMIEAGGRNPAVTNAKRIANVLNFEWTIFFEEKCHDSRNQSDSA